MPGASDALAIKQLLGALKLYHNDVVPTDDDSIALNLTGPRIVGGPEPTQLDLATAQQQLPGAAPDASPVRDAILSGTLPRLLTSKWLQAGPEAAWRGLKDLGSALIAHAPQGRVPLEAIAGPLNTTLGGAALSAAPFALPAIAAAPVTALTGAAVGAAMASGGEHAAQALGAGPETTKLIGNITGNITPGHVAAAALPFVPFGVRSMVGGLEAKGAARIGELLAERPELQPALDWLHPSELSLLSKMSPDAHREFANIHAAMPSNDFLGAAARAGSEKLGWYLHSRAAIEHVFGDDAGLFAGLLAATSPQNSVEMNLQNAVKIYRGWVTAGRPTDERAIIKIMGQNVQGTKGEGSILNSWKNNTVSVLQGGKTISGPKVNSFWRNLSDRPIETASGTMRNEDAVTLDAWMSNVLGVDQTYFSGNSASKDLKARQLASGNPGFGGGYLATTAKLREAASAHGMTPEEIQETIWSWGKALYEQSEATGQSAVDIVKNGTLDPKAVAGTPDFSTLFHDPVYAGAIHGAGRGERLASLKRAKFAARLPDQPGDRELQLQAAAVLDRLRLQRQVGSDLRTGTNPADTVGVTILQEGMPGAKSRVARELQTDAFTQNQRDRIARPLLNTETDVREQNVLLKALGFEPAETTVGQGMWEPKGATEPQFNTLNASSVRARLLADGTMATEDANKILTAARLQGVLNAQDAVAHTGVVYDEGLKKDTLHIFTPNAIKDDLFTDLVKLFPKNKYAFVNKGGGTQGHVLEIIKMGKQPIGDKEADMVRAYLAPSMEKIAITPGTNLHGHYVNVPWGKEGSRKVTAFALEGYDKLPQADKEALDGPAVRKMAAEKLRIWSGAASKQGLTMRRDYLNLLRLVAGGGLSRLRAGLDSPEQLLPVLLALGLGRSAIKTPPPSDPSPVPSS